MNFLADECCDTATVAALRKEGHNILYAVESLRGLPDLKILEQARAEDRILLTEDKDFGEIAIRLHQPVPAIILLRFDVHERGEKISRVRELLEQESENIVGKFIVLELKKIRIRPLP